MKFSDKFISAAEEFCTIEKPINAPYIRKSFLLLKKPEKLEITIAGLGFYELYFNGKNVTKGRLAPYITNPDNIVFYDCYDLTKYISVGENIIGVILGNGMQNSICGNTWDFDKAAFRSSPKMAVAVELDGRILFEADESFKTYNSPILFDDLRAGEHYDARKETSGWNKTGFDDSKWKSAIISAEPCGEKQITRAEPIVVTKKIKPVAVTEVKNGYIYDFGVNIAGLCRLNISGYEGQKVILTYGEVLINGQLDLKNISFAKTTYEGYNQCDIYILSGKGKEIYIPHFTYHGFQYVFVEGIEKKQAVNELLTCLVMNSDLKETSSFSCSDETADKLQECVRRSSLSNFYYFPTDCPHREKNGWTGDAAISAEHMLLNLSAANSLSEWLNCIKKEQRNSGEIPGIIPTAGWGYAWGNGPAWDMVLTTLPFYIYKYTGSKEILTENTDSIFKYLKFMKTKLNEKGLAEYGLGDWCQIDDISYSGADTPLAVTDTLSCMDMCKKAIFIFNETEEKEKQAFAEKLFFDLRNSFRKYLINFETFTVSGNSQTAQSMALYYGAFDKEEEIKAYRVLKGIIIKNNNHLKTGVLGARVIFHILSKFGDSNLAFDMITRKDYPSYGYIIENGASTLWESFDILTDEKNSRVRKDGIKLNSLNHHFWGDISSWFIQEIAGLKINPTGKSCNDAIISPNFITKLNYAKAWHKLPCGKIAVEWKRINNSVELKLNIPKECNCFINIDNKNLKVQSGINKFKILTQN